MNEANPYQFINLDYVSDLGFYALSAKDYVDDCIDSQITLVSGSSVSEAFSHSRRVILMIHKWS